MNSKIQARQEYILIQFSTYSYITPFERRAYPVTLPKEFNGSYAYRRNYLANSFLPADLNLCGIMVATQKDIQELQQMGPARHLELGAV